jgi:hypothetical protein
VNLRRLGVLALVLSIPANATVITRYFGGTITSQTGTGGDIPIGTAFQGSLTYDDTTAHCGCADSQHRDYNLSPPGFIQLTIGSGLYDIQVTNVGAEVENNYTLGGTHDGAFFWSNAMTVTGSGIHTVFSDPSNPLLQWNKAGTSPITDANSLVNLAAELDLAGWVGGFAGVHINLQSAGTVLHGSFTSFTDTPPEGSGVPEPVTLGVTGLTLAGLGVARYRRGPGRA